MVRRTPAHLRSEARGELSVALNGGLRLLPKQEQILTSDAFIRASLGSWGSGKTTAAVLALLRCIFSNPYRPDVHLEDRPMSLVVGLSMRVIKDSAWREIRRICPPELILNEWKAPDPAFEFVNGHMCKAYSVKGSMEGASVCGVLVDEVHLLPNDKAWLNYQARARDPRGVPGTHVALMSGIPVDNGWLRQLVDRPEPDPNRLVVYSSMFENHYLPEHVAREMKKSVSKADADTYLGGKWRKLEGVCFHAFSDSMHVVDRPGDRSRPVSLSCDIGEQGSILFVQEVERVIKVDGRPERASGLHVVDELMPDKLSVAAAMRKAKARGWKIDPRSSVILLDPTTRADEINAVRDVFGSKISVIKRKRGDVREQVEYGVDVVNTALCDSYGNARLTFAKTLPRDQRSILSAIHQYKRNPKTGTITRNNTSDHSCDALRYACVHFMPLKRAGHRVYDRRA